MITQKNKEKKRKNYCPTENSQKITNTLRNSSTTFLCQNLGYLINHRKPRM